MFVGTPGKNWSDPENRAGSFWNGKNLSNLQAVHQDWLWNRRAIEPVETAVMNASQRLDEAERSRLLEAQRLVVEALDSDAEDCLSEMRRELALLLGASAEEVGLLTFGTSDCMESPTMACVYEGPIEFGSRCVFCRLAYR